MYNACNECDLTSCKDCPIELCRQGRLAGACIEQSCDECPNKSQARRECRPYIPCREQGQEIDCDLINILEDLFRTPGVAQLTSPGLYQRITKFMKEYK